MGKPNLLLILVDNLVYEWCANLKGLDMFAPALASICRGQVLCPITANAHATQFVMPSLFSQTYPLDFGGYDRGIADRPCSIVEQIQAAGYRTLGVMGQNLNGPFARLERGFVQFAVVIDHRVLLQKYIQEVVYADVDRYYQTPGGDPKILRKIQKDFSVILNQNAENLHRLRKPHWWSAGTIWKTRKGIANAYAREKALLEEAPKDVIEKLRRLPPHLYFYSLGHRRLDGIFRLKTLAPMFLLRLQGLLGRLPGYSVNIAALRTPPHARELLKVVRDFIASGKDGWFGYVHLMDVHDNRLINRPLKLFQKLRFLPACLRARRQFGKDASMMEMLSIASIDHEVAQLLAWIETRPAADDGTPTYVALTSDHGAGWNSERDAEARKEFGFRTYYEHLTVPLAISVIQGMGDLPEARCGKGGYDTMSVAASILEILRVKPHSSFLGRSIFEPPHEAVISENAGRGNGDVVRKDLFFTVTTQTHKLMVLCQNGMVKPKRLYDLANDPKELFNIIEQPNTTDVVRTLLDHLSARRGELLDMKAEQATPLGAGLSSPPTVGS